MATPDIGDRVVPDLEARVEEAVQAFRANHRHPANLAFHAVGYWFLAKGSIRLLQRKLFSAVFNGGTGMALLLAGHSIEGNEPFTAVRAFRMR